MKIFSLTAGLGLAFAAIAQAEAPLAKTPELKETFGVGVGVGGQQYNGSFGKNTTFYGRGFLTYNPLEWLGTRLTAGYGDLKSGAFGTDWFSNVGMELVLQPKLEDFGPFRPYLATGIATTFGTSTVNGVSNQDLDWNLYAPAELGLEVLLTDNLSFFVWGETYIHMDKWDKLDGVVSQGEYMDRRDDLFKAGAGITVRFGGKPDADQDGILDDVDMCPSTPPGVRIDPKGCPMDMDKDGVPDFKDKCSNTPALTLVDAVGCTLDADKDGVGDDKDMCANTPSGVNVNAKGCPLDADNDGVPDYKDQCASTVAGVVVDGIGCPIPVDSDKDGIFDDKDQCLNTPAGLQVDAKGCPISVDADKDGIPDSMDKCPGTNFGEKVDNTGCVPMVIEKGIKIVLSGIEFKTGSADIEPVSVPVLTRAANALVKAPDAKVEIAGFTDNVGKSKTNLKLSQKRAESVKTQLVKLGAVESQITAKGYGAAEPVASNKTNEGRALNRRIEFRVK